MTTGAIVRLEHLDPPQTRHPTTCPPDPAARHAAPFLRHTTRPSPPNPPNPPNPPSPIA